MEKYKFENNKAVVDLQCIITISKSSVSIEHASNTDSVNIPDAGLTIQVGNVESYNPTELDPEPVPEVTPTPDNPDPVNPDPVNPDTPQTSSHTITLTIKNISGTTISGNEIGILFGEREHATSHISYGYYRVTHIPGLFTLTNGLSTTLTLNLQQASDYETWMNDGNTYFATEQNTSGEVCKSSLAYYSNGTSYLMDALPVNTKYIGGGSYSTTISRANVAWDDANVSWVYTQETSPEPTPTPGGDTPITPGNNRIKLTLTNTSGQEIRLTGRVAFHIVSGSVNNWNTAEQVYLNVTGYSADSNGSWSKNLISVKNNSSISWYASIPSLYLDGNHYFPQENGSNFNYAVLIYSRAWSKSDNDDGGNTGIYHIVPIGQKIQDGGEYSLNLYKVELIRTWEDGRASVIGLDPVTTDKNNYDYIVLGLNKTELGY